MQTTGVLPPVAVLSEKGKIPSEIKLWEASVSHILTDFLLSPKTQFLLRQKVQISNAEPTSDSGTCRARDTKPADFT